MNDIDIVSILKRTSLFYEMKDNDLHEIEKLFCLEVFKENQIIVEEGDPFDKLYIILQGEVSIFQHMGTGFRELSKLTDGDIFGEMALLIGGKRSASARALSETQCLTLNRASLLQVQQNNRAIDEHLERMLIKRIEKTEHSANLSLVEAYNSLLFSLSNLVEARDNETGGHLHRVQHYCRLLALKLVKNNHYPETISPLFIDDIFDVSPMHDIGKVAIPDAILQKPGKLTGDEFKVMKTHAEVGADLFAQIKQKIHYPAFEMGYNLTRYHHERFDGDGYPAGLAGQEIPLEARIMAVADVFDALLSHRYYKQAFDKELVVNLMTEGKAGHFDPVIADTLLESFDEFQEIHRRFS